MTDDEILKKAKDWLDEPCVPDLDGQTSPRNWLREALKAALHDSKRPLGSGGWAYNLAVTMIHAFPEIVTDVQEYSEDDIEFTFDWKKFDQILNGTIDALINEDLTGEI